MGRIAISMSDDLLKKVKRKFGSDVNGALQSIIERGLSEALEAGLQLDKHLEASLIDARKSRFTVADEQFWQRHIDRVRNSKPAKRKRSA